jgi:hypothetical protein
MDNNRFENHVAVKVDAAGAVRTLRSPNDAYDFLLNQWSGKRSDKHRAALQACSDANLGNKPPIAARRALIAAVREAGVLVDEKI